MTQGRQAAGRVLGTVVVALATAAASLTLGAGTAAAAPQTMPQPVRERVAQLERAHAHLAPRTSAAGAAEGGRRVTFRVPGAVAQDDTYLSVNPGCVSRAGGKASVNASVSTSVKVTLDYVLTGPGDYRRSGTITTKAYRENALKLSSVALGHYRLTLAAHGSTTPVADEAFDVLPCVQVKAGCYSVSLTNPAGNPTAWVTYGGKHADAFDLLLAPGETRTVRVDDKKVTFEAVSTSTDPASDVDGVNLGRTTVKVKQSCKHGPAQPGQNAVQTTVLSTCASATTSGAVQLSWSVQASVKDKTQVWQVLDGQQHVVATGSYKNGRHKTVTLPAGSYTYRSLAGTPAQTFEELAVPVLDCVTVTTACHLVQVTNPNAVAVDAYLIDTDEDSDVVDPGEGESLTRVAPTSTATIDWRTRSAVLLALAADVSDGSHVISLASDFPLDDDQDFPEITVPQDC